MSDEYGDVNEQVERILEESPEARPMSDLITATDLEGYRSIARELAMRVRGMQARNETDSHPSPPRPSKEKAISVREAIERKNWSEYLSAKWEQNGKERDNA